MVESLISASGHVPKSSSSRYASHVMQMARSKKACIVFFDEVDAIGGARFDDGAGGDNEVQRTMLEIVNQLDGFDARGNIKVLMATNRPDTLDPALLRPGRLDRKIEFGLPDLKARTQIFTIHTKCAIVLCSLATCGQSIFGEAVLVEGSKCYPHHVAWHNDQPMSNHSRASRKRSHH